MNRSDSPTDRFDSADSAVRVDHLGRDMAAALLSRSEKLEPTIEARLATARQAALAAARDARSAQFAPEMALQSTTASGGRTPRQRAWLGWLLPASVLIAGLLLLAHSQWVQETLGLADRDARVLRDDLPPNAYGDPGFNEYLDEKSEEETPPPDEEEAQP